VQRKVLHLDLDAFFCAVEELRDPGLRAKPFAVGGRPDQRGVVSSCSYAARMYGVRSAMPTARALRLCPHLEIIAGHYDAYGRASRDVMRLAGTLTPLVERISIDEAFLDVSDLPQAGEEIARRLQAAINRDMQLPCSLGVATNKLVAKIANNVGKSAHRGDTPPNAITAVAAGSEADFLAPLPVDELWGIGPRTADRLRARGVHTIGDLARRREDELVQLLGKHGRSLWLAARGIDDSPVVIEHEARSMSQETTFARDVTDEVTLRRTLRTLAETVGRRLRRHRVCGTTIRIKLRWADFTTVTRQVTLSRPTDRDRVICDEALRLFAIAWPRGRPVRLVGVGVSGFEGGAYQLEMWNNPHLDRLRRLEATLDGLRDRYGSRVVRRASDLAMRSTEENET
jgi:DNA polymerase-4